MKSIIIVVALAISVASQRPFYAGLRPSGNTNGQGESQKIMDDSGLPINRFGDENVIASTTTSNLPADALGDSYLISILKTYPIDQQPFWYINRDIIESTRNNQLPTNQLPVVQRSSFFSSNGFKNER